MATTNPGLQIERGQAERLSAATSERRDAAHEPEPVQLVWTRLRPPMRASGSVRRRRLSGAADQLRHRLLTVIRAPAGYGKSSLLGQWFDGLKAVGAAVGWLSQGSTRDDLTSFLLYAIGALRESRPDFGQRVTALLGAQTRPTVAAVAAAFINSFKGVEEHVLLFIDDFHLVDDAEVIACLEAIIAKPPLNFHLVVSSRHALALSTSRLRSKGQLLEIEADQLRFDNREAAEFLHAAGHDNLSPSEVELLVTRTEGWPAGLQLASISLAQSHDFGSVSSALTGSHRHLSQYLADDVVNNLPQDTIDFLLRTSLLPRFSPALCDAVTGRQTARAELDRLERQGLFIASLDNERQWYRYHHLFAAFLQRRLSDQFPDEVSRLHRKASDWFAAQGLTEEAFAHAIEARDTERAGEILDDAADRLFYTGRLTTLMRWSERLPDAELRRRPRARLHIAWSMILEWRFEDAARIIHDVEVTLSLADKPPGRKPSTQLEYVVQHRKMMLYHFMDEVPEMERILLALLEDFPDSDHYLHGNLDTCMIYAGRERYRLGEVDKRDIHARRDYAKAGSDFVSVWHESIMGPTYYLRGDTRLAARSLSAAMVTAEGIGGEICSLVAMPALLLADLLYETDEPEKAAALIEKFGAEAEKQGFVDHLIAYYVTHARLAARRNGPEEAGRILRAGRLSAVRHGFARLERFVELEEVRLWAASGDLAALRRFVVARNGEEMERALRPGTHTTTADEATALAWCRATAALGRQADAVKALRRWAVFASGRGALRTEVRVMIALAVALVQDGREGEALRVLREAVQKAARPRFIRSFVDEGKVVEAMLRKLVDRGDATADAIAAFALELLERFPAEQGGEAERDAAPPAGPQDGGDLYLPVPLSQRETEIMRLVAKGLSNKEIGTRLGLTEGSVKWYLHEVFAKLGVTRRMLAVVAARKLGII